MAKTKTVKAAPVLKSARPESDTTKRAIITFSNDCTVEVSCEIVHGYYYVKLTNRGAESYSSGSLEPIE